jgi:hypothetical protein
MTLIASYVSLAVSNLRILQRNMTILLYFTLFTTDHSKAYSFSLFVGQYTFGIRIKYYRFSHLRKVGI